MAASDFKNWRGYLYIGIGLAFGIYRGVQVTEWSSWDLVDQAIALAMVGIGFFLVVRK